MKDVSFWVLKTLCDFMYTGEVQVLQTKLEELLTVAENLKVIEKLLLLYRVAYLFSTRASTLMKIKRKINLEIIIII